MQRQPCTFASDPSLSSQPLLVARWQPAYARFGAVCSWASCCPAPCLSTFAKSRFIQLELFFQVAINYQAYKRLSSSLTMRRLQLLRPFRSSSDADAPRSDGPSQSLCHVCRHLNFRLLFSPSPRDPDVDFTADGVGYRISWDVAETVRQATRCVFCQLLLEALRTTDESTAPAWLLAPSGASWKLLPSSITQHFHCISGLLGHCHKSRHCTGS